MKLIIKNGRFEKIGNDLLSEGEDIDAAGLFLFPGVIDDQCHFREPGLTERGSIKTESLSAIAGGTTSFMDMPNVIPPTLSLDLWRDKISIAEKTASANFSFYMGTSNSNVDEIKAIFQSYNLEIDLIGETTKEKYIKINNKIDLNTEEAKELWLNGLRDKIK